MKKIFVVVLALFAVGCENTEEVRARQENYWVQCFQADANKVVRNIQYIKDTRTGLCFAYCWGGPGGNEAVLATVPCEAVPPQLLTVAK